jgi:chemotaxis family two-component system response regulator Rcp1
MERSPVTVLLVEDNLGDVFLVREALEQLGLDVQFRTVPDGETAMDILRLPGTRRPDVIILDLNLPLKHGREVLAELDADPALRHIPVAILTTSTSEDDAALRLTRDNCLFFAKTPDLRELMNILTQIHDFARSTRKAS